MTRRKRYKLRRRHRKDAVLSFRVPEQVDPADEIEVIVHKKSEPEPAEPAETQETATVSKPSQPAVIPQKQKETQETATVSKLPETTPTPPKLVGEVQPKPPLPAAQTKSREIWAFNAGDINAAELARTLKPHMNPIGYSNGKHRLPFGDKGYQLWSHVNTHPARISSDGNLQMICIPGLYVDGNNKYPVAHAEIKSPTPATEIDNNGRLKLGTTYVFRFRLRPTNPWMIDSGHWFGAAQFWGPNYGRNKKWSNPVVKLNLASGQWKVEVTSGDPQREKNYRIIGPVPHDGSRAWQDFELVYRPHSTKGLVEATYNGKSMGKAVTGETTVRGQTPGPIWKWGCYASRKVCRSGKPKEGVGFEFSNVYAGAIE